MRIAPPSQSQGIALIIVMIVITVFSIMVAGFAYSMKVETKLARNATFDPEMEWLGRSGIELAKYVLGQQRSIPNEPYDSLNQKWAGGPGNSNSVLADVTLENNQLGRGTFSVKITDCERKFNINVADEQTIEMALNLIGVEPSESGAVVSSILDWIDPDDDTRVNGAESDFYQQFKPPYVAKNGPLDDIMELLLIRGVTPEMFWGPRYTGPPTTDTRRRARVGFSDTVERTTYAVGLLDLFTPFSSRFVNLNTASATTLQMIPGIETDAASAIIQYRSGLDGQEATEDDMPFRSVAELMNVPGIDRQMIAPMSRFFSTQSTTFEVEVTVTLDNRTRVYSAVLRRVDGRTIQVLKLHWK